MRVHITLPDELVSALDGRVGPRGRSAFIAQALAKALDDDRRWDLIDSALGAIEDRGHDWDVDAAQWVRSQRHALGR